MKKYIIKGIIPLVLGVLIISGLFQSCDKSSLPVNEETPTSRVKVFSADPSFGVVTKTSLSGLSLSWIAGDKVGVFSPEARSAPASGPGVNNLVYTASTTALSSEFTGDMYWGVGSHSFYAYYPHKTGSFNATAVPIELPAIQTQAGESSSHLAVYDMLIANPVTGISAGTTGEASSVNFKFNHVFTLLDFKIVALGDKQVEYVEIVAPASTKLSVSAGTIDITGASPEQYVPYVITDIAGSNTVKINIAGSLVCGRRFATTPSVFLMINPSDLTGVNNLTINVKFVGQVAVLPVIKNGISFKRGTKYLVKVADVGIDINDPEANLGSSTLYEEL